MQQAHEGECAITNQDKKAWLLRYRTCEREITRIEDEITRWESRAEKVTASYHVTPGGGSGGGDRIQSAVDEIAELRGMLYDRLIDATETRRNIERAIQSVGDKRLRLLLEYRYIEGMRLEEIAIRINLEYRWVKRLVNRSIEKLTPESPL